MRSIAFMAAALLLGCNDTVSVGNDNPTGFVGGIIIDAANEMPLSGAMVKVVSASATLTAMTTADGLFKVERVPAGSLIITITQAGFQTATFNAQLPGNIGNFPVKNPTLTLGPLGLVRNDGTFTVRIVEQSGAPANGITAIARTQVRYFDFSDGRPRAVGTTAITGTSGMDGLITFMGLPNYAALGGIVNDIVFVDVAPIKVMGTETYAFLGLTATFQLGSLTSPVQTIVLAGPRTPLAITDSNLDHLRIGGQFNAPVGSLIGQSGPITVAFNQAINPSTIRAQFYTENNVIATVQPTVTVQTNLVTITPTMALPAGVRFNLTLHADALAATSSEVNAAAPFWVAQPAGVNVTVVNMTGKIEQSGVNNNIVTFTLNEAIGLGRGLSGAIGCVAFFESPVNFDAAADPNAPYQGEYGNGDIAKLTCPGINPVASPPPVDVTAITPLEIPFSGIGATGFSTRWSITLGNPSTATAGLANGCQSTVICSQPVVGSKVHLVFSKQGIGSTVRRVSGQPLDDKMTLTLAP
jgi:hypothetical protein